MFPPIVINVSIQCTSFVSVDHLCGHFQHYIILRPMIVGATAAYLPTFISDRFCQWAYLTWFAVPIIQFCAIAYAYLPDLTNDESVFTVLMVVYLAIKMTTSLSHNLECPLPCSRKFGLGAWLKKRVICKTLWMAGFEQNLSHFHESVLTWFFLSHSVSDATVVSLSLCTAFVL